VQHHNTGTIRRTRKDRGVMNQRDYKNPSSESSEEDNNDTESSSDSSTMSVPDKVFSQDDRAVFEKARNLLNPSRFFRWIIYLYAQRKMNIFFFIHFTSTIVIWMHFALIKFEQQAGKVPDGAHRYWLKRLVPPIEFGSMHAILFQMALIPITMCRCSISTLAESTVNKVIPLNRALAMHIHLGYTMIIIVFFATIFFFFFFGLLCSEGEQAFCDKFTMEIMITGYCILGTLLIIALTSHFRHRIPYEIFYAVHHVVFLMYIITIAHTLDMEQRSGRSQRSQTFKWFSSTLLYYFCDRIAMHMNHRYDTKLISSSIVWGSEGSKLIIMKVRRPALFHFKSGQYAYIRIDAINNQWHPFSIASRPDCSHLEFYIQVYEGKAWTKQLWDLFDDESSSGKIEVQNLKIEVMGPYGTSLSHNQNYSHILAIGGGTGVVPILSMYKDHIHNLLRLDPNKFFAELDESDQKLRRIEHAEDAQKGSLIQQVSRLFCRKYSSNVNGRKTLSKSIRKSIVDHDELQNEDQIKMKKREIYTSATVAALPIYGTVLLSILPVAGVTLFSLIVSWNTIPIELYTRMALFLK
jgi:predicted ferric reductase